MIGWIVGRFDRWIDRQMNVCIRRTLEFMYIFTLEREKENTHMYACNKMNKKAFGGI